MNTLSRPAWVLATVTLPQALLASAGVAAWQAVAPQLAERGTRSWAGAGALLALLLAGFTAVALRVLRARRPLPPAFGAALLAAYLPFLSAVVFCFAGLVPPEVPRWMLSSDDFQALAVTLLMPALLHGLFLSVAWATPDARTASLAKSFGGAVAVPLGWYLGSFAVPAAWGARSLHAVFPALAILSIVAFLFFVVRAAHLVVVRRMDGFLRFRPLWIAAVAVVLPQLGLALHGGLLLGGTLPRGPFGDFGHPAFYALAAVNGVLLCLPVPAAPAARWALAGGRALLFPFTLYFFLVFLPYFPLSVFAVLAFGLGLLMLTPLALMHVHAAALREDFARLRAGAGSARSAAVLVAAALVLPALVVAGCLRDRTVLRAALDHVYAPDYASAGPSPVDPAALERVLAHVRLHKEKVGREAVGGRVPYLSLLYQRIVLGRPTLSDAAVRELKAVFLGAVDLGTPGSVADAAGAGEVAVSGATAASTQIDGGRALRTAVELEIVNAGTRPLEFAASFALPADAWIGGLHLRVGDRDEPGILADSRAAAWVYRRIVATRRDPAVLYRQPDGRLALRVFPVAAGETRRVGFAVVHREPFVLRLGGRELPLGEGHAAPQDAAVVRVGGGEVHFVPQAVKRRLPAVRRTPVVHILVDCSASAAARREDFVRRIGLFLARSPVASAPVRFTLVDAGGTSFAGGPGWERRVREHRGEGGFFLGRSVKAILRREHEEQGATYPLLVVVTDAMEGALVPGGLADFAFAAPEADSLHRLGPDGELTTWRFGDLRTPAAAGDPAWTAAPVLAYPGRDRPLAYLRDDGAGSVVLVGGALFDGPDAVAGPAWESGLALAGAWRALQLDPVDRRHKELLLVRRSCAAGIMTPATSFLALEEEAQKRALLQRQERVLAPQGVLEVDEDSFEQMSEPGCPTLVALLALALVLPRLRGTVGRLRGRTG